MPPTVNTVIRAAASRTNGTGQPSPAASRSTRVNITAQYTAMTVPRTLHHASLLRLTVRTNRSST
jgi:hypothetical protein